MPITAPELLSSGRDRLRLGRGARTGRGATGRVGRLSPRRDGGGPRLPSGRRRTCCGRSAIPWQTCGCWSSAKTLIPPRATRSGSAFAVDRARTAAPAQPAQHLPRIARRPRRAVPGHGDLSPWAAQGVMLLNRVLTGAAGQFRSAPRQRAGSRSPALAIRTLVARSSPLVAILWGNDARSLLPLLGGTPVIQSAHPSPLSRGAGSSARNRSAGRTNFWSPRVPNRSTGRFRTEPDHRSDPSAGCLTGACPLGEVIEIENLVEALRCRHGRQRPELQRAHPDRSPVSSARTGRARRRRSARCSDWSVLRPARPPSAARPTETSNIRWPPWDGTGSGKLPSGTLGARPPRHLRARRGHRPLPGGHRARPGRPRGFRLPTGRRVLPRDAAATRARLRAARRPRGVRAGRADQRPRPRRHPLDPHLPPRAGQGGSHRAGFLAPAQRGAAER